MDEAVVTEVEAVDEGECRVGSLDLGHRDRAVQCHDRARGQRHELVIELQDLPPVRGGRDWRVAAAIQTANSRASVSAGIAPASTSAVIRCSNPATLALRRLRSRSATSADCRVQFAPIGIDNLPTVTIYIDP
ncbi:MAG: hypothetical protein ACRDRG_11225 [Pseudonocardiaceae bacterium]